MTTQDHMSYNRPESNTGFATPEEGRAIPLNARATNAIKNSVWPVSSLHSPLEACEKDRQSSSGFTCCKELLETESRHLVDPDIVRDLVIGLADGLTVPFALTAGLSGLGSTHFVVTAGLAELISGAISMGIGGYLSAEAERSQFLYLHHATQERVSVSCIGQLARDTHEVLKSTGIDPQTSAMVALSLQKAGNEPGVARSKPSIFTKRWYTERIGDGPGLTHFLMQFGEDAQEATRLRVLMSGLTVGLGYLLGGIIPMIPYFIVKSNVRTALWWSIGLTSIALLLFGVVKSRITGAKHGIGRITYGALSTLALGGAAAAASYGVVKALEHTSQ